MKYRLASSSRPLSLAMTIVFALVGLVFLFFPGGVVSFFNSLSRPLGFRPTPEAGPNIYLILAVAYMAIVTFLAWLMYRHPEDEGLPLILGAAKLTSSVLSFGFFFGVAPYLVYLANGVVDGLIGVVVLSCRAALKAAHRDHP